MPDGGNRADALAWGSILTVIDAVAAVEDPKSFGPVVLEALAEVVPFDMASYNEVDTAAGRAIYQAYPPNIPTNGADNDAFPVLIRQNPILRHQEATGDGSAYRISDFMTTEELHDLELYRRVYGPLRVEFQVAFALATKQPLVIACALNRHERDFNTRELETLNVLRPHLIQAYRNVQLLTALRGIEGALAEVGKGVVVLEQSNAKGRSAPWVQRTLVEHFGPAANGSLPDAVGEWVAEQRRREFDDGQPRIHQPLVSVAGDRQLVVRFIPASADRSDVLVVDERERGREINELRRLGLTPREAEILLLVTQGESTTASAQRIGVTAATLSKHLQNIYRKLGVTSRTAAIATATDAIFSAR